MKKILPGDIVGRRVKGELCYYSVDKVEKGRLICIPLVDDDDCWDGKTVALDPAKVAHYPAVKVSKDDVRRLLRYEAPFSEIFGELEPRWRFKCDNKPEMTGEDLLAALRRCKERGFERAEKEWIEPVGALCGELFDGFEWGFRVDGPVDGYRFLPSESQLFFPIYAAVMWRTWRDADEPDLDGLIGETARTLNMLTLPVPERDYADGWKEQYIKRLGHDDVLPGATDEETALWVKYVDELCEKDNVAGLRAKAYSLYGGNSAYKCDWRGSRDLLLKLMELDDDPFLANTLGYIFYYGRCTGGEPEYDKAFYYFNIGAAGGVYESRYKLADMYLHGRGVGKNLRVARDIINELYYENKKYIYQGVRVCKFADVALRMGNLYRDEDPDEAYRYYLEAEFAIKRRMLKDDCYGDRTVAENIKKAIEDVLPKTAFAKARRTVRYAGIPYEIFSTAFELHLRVEAKVKKLKSGQYALRFRVLPKNKENVPGFFITEPAARFCGYVNRLTLKTKKIYNFKIDGKDFDGDSATVVFDEAGPAGSYLYGSRVMKLDAEFEATFPDTEKCRRYAFAAVAFRDGGDTYDYLCGGLNVAPGDKVAVPTSTGEAEARVIKTFEIAEFETDKPLSYYKRVIGKA
ncbi:MAG: sel1 repeat family protein [Clostridia bacterium]|nr:sel1 repeat family protein [Clostridia bacterium]